MVIVVMYNLACLLQLIYCRVRTIRKPIQ